MLPIQQENLLEAACLVFDEDAKVKLLIASYLEDMGLTASLGISASDFDSLKEYCWSKIKHEPLIKTRTTVSPEGTLLVEHFDANGNVTYINDEETCEEKTFKYDDKHRTIYSLFTNGDKTIEESWEYDDRDNITRYINKATGIDYSSEFDEFGHEVEFVDNITGESTTRTYNSDGRVESEVVITGRLKSTYTFSYEFDDLGNLLKQMRSDGSVLWARYDEHGNMIARGNNDDGITHTFILAYY